MSRNTVQGCPLRVSCSSWHVCRAGFLLLLSDIRLLLVAGICTFFVTVAATLAVNHGITTS